MPEAEERRALPLANFAIDNVCLIAIWVLVAVLEWGVEPFHRGFFCDDECIQYPYLKQSVSFGVMILLAGVPPLITMTAVEMWRVRQQHLPVVQMGSQTLPPLLVQVGQHFVGVFLFGAGGTLLLTEVGKSLVGRLRPHFLVVCDPDPAWMAEQCFENASKWVNAPIPCRGEISSVREARLSFPSGHSSLAFYAAVCTSLYLQARLAGRVRSRLLLPTVQVGAVVAALAIALTRVSDNYHHPTDVIAGALTGTAGALLTAYVVSDWFYKRRRMDERLPLNQTTNWPKLTEVTTNRHEVGP